MSCATQQAPRHVLLFGDYQWNRRLSPVATEVDKLSFAARRASDPSNWWERENIVLPEGVSRVRDWADAILWIRSHGL